MNTPWVDMGLVLDALEPAVLALVKAYGAAYDVAPSPPLPAPTLPPVLAVSLSRLFEVLRGIESGFAAAGPSGEGALSRHDVSILGNYGIRLLDEAARWANDLDDPVLSHELASLILPLACWTGRGGGELTALKPIVDNLIGWTDQITDMADSERLFSVMDDIFGAVKPVAVLDTKRSNAYPFWRILILNRAMLATRTYQCSLMERAFRTLVLHLPEDAAEFFREGVARVEHPDCPPQARELLFAYDQAWGGLPVASTTLAQGIVT